MTLSIAARCAESGQNITLPALGQQILARLEGGAPEQALKCVLAEYRFSEYRQDTVIDACGRSATFSDDKTRSTIIFSLPFSAMAAKSFNY